MTRNQQIQYWRRLAARALKLEQWGAEALFRLKADKLEWGIKADAKEN